MSKKEKEYLEECRLQRIQELEDEIKEGPKTLQKELDLLRRMTSYSRMKSSFGQYDNFSAIATANHEKAMNRKRDLLDELRNTKDYRPSWWA